MSKRVDWLSRDLVQNPYFVGLATNEEAFKREMRRLKIPTDRRPPFLTTAHADATVHYFEQGTKAIALVCLRKPTKRTVIEVHGLLVHEAMHIWRAIREHMGEDTPSAEFEAYSVQTIAQRLMEAWARA